MSEISFAQRMYAQNKRKEAAIWLRKYNGVPDTLYYQLYRESRKYYEGFVFAIYLGVCSKYKNMAALERELKKPIK